MRRCQKKRIRGMLLMKFKVVFLIFVFVLSLSLISAKPIESEGYYISSDSVDKVIKPDNYLMIF